MELEPEEMDIGNESVSFLAGEQETISEGRFINVRLDLQPYFEVIDHEKCRVKCKLSETGQCNYDGVKNTFIYYSQRGWYSFQRHLRKKHNIITERKEEIQKGHPRARKTKASSTRKGLKLKTTISSETELEQDQNYPDFSWKSLKTSQQYCFICHKTCSPSYCESYTLSHLFSNGTDTDIGRLPFDSKSGHKDVLSEQLFVIFFLRDIIDFPLSQCVKFLKQFRGRMSPDVWIKFCSSCKNSVIEAAQVRRNISELEKRFLKLKRTINDQVQVGNVGVEVPGRSVNTDLGNIESHIRNYIRSTARPSSEACLKPTNKVKTKQSKPEEQTVEYLIFENDVNCKVEPLSPEPPLDPLDEDYEPNNDLPDIDNNYSSDASESEFNSRPMKKMSSQVTHGLPSTDTGDNDDKDKDTVEEGTSKSKIQRGSSNVKRKRVRSEFMCELCPTKFSRLRSFKDHLNLHHISNLRNNEHDCSKCGFPSLSENGIKIHMGVKHKDKNDLLCSLCPYIAPSKRILTQHFSEHKSNSLKERVDGKFLCVYCKRLFETYVLLCRHKRMKHYEEIGVSPLRCPVCSEIFSCRQHLRSHVRQVHEKKSKYFCEICGRGFLFISKLKRHANSHSTDRSHVCDVCGADFRYRDSLRNHLRDEHPECEEATKADQSSGNNIIYRCKHCGRDFSTKALRHQHQRRDHKELYTFQCDQCEHSYATVQSLRRHKEINHSSVLDKPCPYCGKMFQHQEYVRMHFKFCKSHPNFKISDKLAGECLNKDVDPSQKAEIIKSNEKCEQPGSHFLIPKADEWI